MPDGLVMLSVRENLDSRQSKFPITDKTLQLLEIVRNNNLKLVMPESKLETDRHIKPTNPQLYLHIRGFKKHEK